MIKVQSPTPQTREELTNIAQLFNAKIVDVQRRSLVLRLTGREDHIEALLEMLKDYDIIEIARTGRFPCPAAKWPSRICRERMNTMRVMLLKRALPEPPIVRYSMLWAIAMKIAETVDRYL